MKFLGINLVENFSTIVVTSGDANKIYLYDRNFSTRWTSAASNDTTTETITITWGTNKTFNRISLLGHNLKQFTIQYWTGAAYADFSTPITETANTLTDELFTFNSVTTTRLQLTATKTLVADAQKYIGELIAYLEDFDIPEDELPDAENRVAYFKQIEHEKVNGGSVIIIEATSPKYQNVFTFNNLSKTYRDEIEDLKELHQSFWIIPDDDTPAEQYYCNMINYQFNKTDAWTTAGERCYRGSFEVKET